MRNSRHLTSFLCSILIKMVKTNFTSHRKTHFSWVEKLTEKPFNIKHLSFSLISYHTSKLSNESFSVKSVYLRCTNESSILKTIKREAKGVPFTCITHYLILITIFDAGFYGNWKLCERWKCVLYVLCVCMCVCVCCVFTFKDETGEFMNFKNGQPNELSIQPTKTSTIASKWRRKTRFHCLIILLLNIAIVYVKVSYRSRHCQPLYKDIWPPNDRWFTIYRFSNFPCDHTHCIRHPFSHSWKLKEEK